ncbi:hypothetical protein PR202_ga23422 [Eleusine coracana subsp. coracana]|uniref:Uncharacterized protein n=1 Tax=Eleusine coracana subsp. coracana TaxID=191504 RepID=A0AAV5D469_ELECO|nr:hypothetical protein PR202_ga23422 [Eleusine coracana subsp. coracana]
MVLVLDTKTMAAVRGSSASRTAVYLAFTPSTTTRTTILMEVVVAEGATEVKTVAAAEDATATVGPPVVWLQTAQKDEEKKSGECRVWHGTHCVEELDETYVRSDHTKEALLASAGGYAGGKLLQLPEPQTQQEPASKEFYRCPYNSYTECQTNLTRVSGTGCHSCGKSMTTKMKLVDSSSGLVVS